MSKFKPIRGKKKEAPPKAGAVGCVLAIVALMAMFILIFWAALRPVE
jgi:hypothetical protein